MAENKIFNWANDAYTKLETTVSKMYSDLDKGGLITPEMKIDQQILENKIEDKTGEIFKDTFWTVLKFKLSQPKMLFTIGFIVVVFSMIKLKKVKI